MRMNPALSLLLAAILTNPFAMAQDNAREIRRSPDGRFYGGWFDHDAGAPFGIIRPIVVRSTTGVYDIFSFVSVPRSTDAAWNAASTRCVIADAPDNGGPNTWLVYRRGPDQWASRELDPFAPLYEAFLKADPGAQLFRPSILKITWLSNTEVRFRGYCNTGTYLITMDTAAPEKLPETKKLSEKFLEE